jgi:long-chain acyl-CoA synthetase
VKIVDLDGKDCGLEGPGEIWIKGPQVMAGYWQRPEETEKAMTADGWFKSGDVGVMLPDGQFKIVDRMKDMVLVSGFNVYPNEVEEVIAGHAGVLEVAVIGLPDAHSGEAVAAYVVKKNPDVTEADIIKHCREELTGYKVPRTVVFRDALPKTNVGKVLRRVLRDEVMGKV